MQLTTVRCDLCHKEVTGSKPDDWWSLTCRRSGRGRTAIVLHACDECSIKVLSLDLHEVEVGAGDL